MEQQHILSSLADYYSRLVLGTQPLRPVVMAWTARKDDEKKEYFDSPGELEQKVGELADWIRDTSLLWSLSVRKGQQSPRMRTNIAFVRKRIFEVLAILSPLFRQETVCSGKTGYPKHLSNLFSC